MLSLDITTGSYTLIAGPTGSGKSTLALAMIGAIEAATGGRPLGELEVMGRAVGRLDAAERSRLVAAVWQRPDVQLFRSTILDEVRSSFDHRLIPAAESDRRARHLLHLVGLDHLPESRDPVTLSGGEQQRLALAAALALDAPVLVLDEATSALDASAAQRFSEALDQVRAEREITVVAVDHRPDAHLARADRMLVLDHGRIVLDDAPEAIYSAHRAEAARLGLRFPDRQRSQESAAKASPRGMMNGHTEPLLILQNATVTVTGTQILAPVTAALPKGAVVLVTGENGSGKSTLLRMLATEIRNSTGHVVPSRRRRVRSGIGWAPQRAAELLLTGSVREELCSVVAHGGRGDDEAARLMADDLLAAVELEAYASAHPLRLSGGQRQRLAVAAALAGTADDPALVLLDEPTSGQDRHGSDLLLTLIAARAAGRVTLIATHEPHAFESLATHRIHLSPASGSLAMT